MFHLMVSRNIIYKYFIDLISSGEVSVLFVSHNHLGNKGLNSRTFHIKNIENIYFSENVQISKYFDL